MLPRKPIDFVPLPIMTRSGVKADVFAKPMCEIWTYVESYMISPIESKNNNASYHKNLSS